MVIAAIVTLICHQLKQPVVLGYIVAGVIIGPHSFSFPLVSDQATIRTLAELGIIFLMFSLGLEFSLGKLKKVGMTALVAAGSEIILMIWLGHEIGRYFGWSTMDSLFLGAMLSISSTTIIVKALEELGKKREGFAQLIFGILIVEDILAIALIALLSSIAMTGTVEVTQVATTLGKLGLFITVALMLGLLLVPRLLNYVARFNSREMLLVTVLGLCFGFCLLVIKLGYSVALGAFIMGAIMAEARQLKQIERLIEPVRDMFSAIFFVAIGLMLDPGVMLEYAGPIAILTVAVVVGKIVTCSLGTLLSGHDGRTSLKVGMGLAQIGEFSFIIAALGTSLKVTSDFLYPVAVTVSVLTTLFTPYLIRGSDPVAQLLHRCTPRSLSAVFGYYTSWLESLRLEGDHALVATLIRRIVFQVLLNLAIVAAVFMAGSYLAAHRGNLPHFPHPYDGVGVWTCCLLISLPFQIAMFRKLQTLSLLLAEIGLSGSPIGQQPRAIRAVIAQVIPLAAIGGITLWMIALSSAILPPMDVLIAMVAAMLVIALILWRQFVKLHSRLQIALLETFEEPEKPQQLAPKQAVES